MIIEINTKSKTYPVYIERGMLGRVSEVIGAERSVFIVSDNGVPRQYKDALSEQFPLAGSFEIKQGEPSKCMEYYKAILEEMLLHQISRNDCIIALGGGVVGDLAGFVAATYMRGIAFVNIPTTTLSQIDSSIGGKTAINLGGVKNCVGAFRQPEAVIIDPDVLATLPARHISNGLAEAVKAGVIGDAALFEIFEKDDYLEHIEEIIERSLLVKKAIVEADETEEGERMLLNFGHTVGHAIEALTGFREMLHGECISIGMLAMCENEALRGRLCAVLERLKLPTKTREKANDILYLIEKDKKADHGKITVALAGEIGKAYLKTVEITSLRERL